MKNSNVASIAHLQGSMVLFKQAFPNAIWSISEPVFEKWRKANKDRGHGPLPFSIYLATDDLIGMPSHKFVVVECDDIADGLLKAVHEIMDQIKETKAKS